MNNFIYYTPTKVYFGKDEELNVGKYIKDFGGHNVLVVYGMNSVIKSGLLQRVLDVINNEGLKVFTLGGVKPNPELDLVYKGIDICRKNDIDFVLAIGGGSVIDTAKDISNGTYYEGDVWDFHIGKNKPSKAIKKACILTLAAAGSEMSDSSVITNPETKIKRGYNNEFNRMDFAILNPELTLSVPPFQIGCGVVDIAMHTMERYFSISDESILTDEFALSLISTTFKVGKRIYEEPDNVSLRGELMWASSIAHNGLTGCGRKLSMPVHQLEHSVSALYPEIAHGAGLSALWASWARGAYPHCIDRFIKYVKEVWDIEESDIDKAINMGIDKQEEFYHQINMPTSLEELGVKEKDLETLALMTSNNKSRTIPGYYEIGYEEMLNIYKKAYKNKF